MDPGILADAEKSFAPVTWAAGGAAVAIGLFLLSRRGRPFSVPLRFLAAVGATWVATCTIYAIVRPAAPFEAYLLTSTLATQTIAVMGAVFYVGSIFTLPDGERRWRRSSALLAGVTLMGSAFVRAAYQPGIALAVEAPLAVLFIATVWRFRAEPLVYLAILAVAVTVVLGARNHLAAGSQTPASAWMTSTAAGVSLVMVVAAAILGLARRQELNVRWYRQGLLIVPLVASSLAAMGAGYVAVWYGASWHTAFALGSWWAVLLVAAIGLRQPDLFGFSSVAAALAAVAAFTVLGGDKAGGYWGRYPAVLLAIALGAAILSALLRPVLRGPATAAFPRALYVAAAAVAIGALAVEPFGTTAVALGVDLLIAAGVLALAHAHQAPAWVNYLVAGLMTGGLAALAHLGPGTSATALNRRFIQAAGGAGVAWLAISLILREVLRRTASDRTARRQTLPLTVFGMVTTLALAAYLILQQVRIYEQLFVDGKSPTLEAMGPSLGFIGWMAVLLAWLLSMWLVRHTARTFLFYCFGIAAVAYTGLLYNMDDPYSYLIYAVAGYGASHLLVYLYEAKFMALLSRTCALYHDEGRASTTIFTLAVMSCFIAAILAVFRLNTQPALIMLAIMAAVFLLWSFVWLRGEMLYPAVLMVALTTLASWHNVAHPTMWDGGRVAINSGLMSAWALVWLGIGKGLQPIRGEAFQLAAPARACSVILGFVATIFAAGLAVSPTFGAAVWRQPRSVWDWTLGLTALVLLMAYFTWARFAFGRRFYGLMAGFGVLLLGLYVGIYIGVRLVAPAS
jgi:hypothetical protein